MNDNNVFGLIRTLFLGFGVFLLVVAATYLILPVILILSLGGIFVGGATSIRNYIRAFRRNVRPEQA